MIVLIPVKSCVKYYNTLRPWAEARLFCEDKGAGLLYVKDENDQKVINQLLQGIAESNKDTYEGAWLDITDLNSYDPSNPEMEWYHYGPASYQNWVYGEPETTEARWPGSTCGVIKKGGETTLNQNWSAEYCRNFNQHVCQKQTGQTCPDGWVLKQFWNAELNQSESKCYFFVLNGRDHKSWYEVVQYCKAIGARSLHVESEGEQSMISHYYSDWQRAGVTRIWMELSDLATDKPSDGPCDYMNGLYI